ncbi:MAG: beta-exotoxin transport system permease protein [Solirubrobacteraceae bacterium]|jgi:ABC-2 type transport system permease protein|nr:beta-exotoxin transport system permease protein [Solirubrobacteraceae bacterium]
MSTAVHATSATARHAPRRAHSFVALVRQGLRDNRRAPLTWGGSLGAMTALMTALWPSIEGSAAKLVDSYPAGLKEAFGISQLDSVEAYVDAEMLSLMIPLALGFFAVRCAVRATVGAEDRGHLDTLLALPLSRRTLVGASFAVTGLVLLSILTVIWALTWITGTVVGAGMSASALAAGLVNVWPLTMLFAGVATLAAGIVHRPATVTAIAAGALAATYVLDVAGKLAGAIEPLRALSPFRWYGSAIQHGLDVSHVVALTLVAVVLAAAGAQLFERRDVL